MSNAVTEGFLNQVWDQRWDNIRKITLTSVEKVDWAGGMRMVNGKIMATRKQKAVELIWMRMVLIVSVEME